MSSKLHISITELVLMEVYYHYILLSDTNHELLTTNLVLRDTSDSSSVCFRSICGNFNWNLNNTLALSTTLPKRRERERERERESVRECVRACVCVFDSRSFI